MLSPKIQLPFYQIFNYEVIFISKKVKKAYIILNVRITTILQQNSDDIQKSTMCSNMQCCASMLYR